ncbi:elongation factor P [bacterium]|nr:elongation factor P [bacterium]
MITAADFRKGMKISYKGEPYEIIDFQKVMMARGRGFVRTKLKNLKTGFVVEYSFSSDERFPEPNFSVRKVQYLYSDGREYHFMDSSTYEQFSISSNQLGDSRWFLKEGTEYKLLFFEERPLSIDLPASVELKVVETEPGVKGDTVNAPTKPAKLETGLVIKVPLFVNEDDVVKVDTRTKEYLGRR